MKRQQLSLYCRNRTIFPYAQPTLCWHCQYSFHDPCLQPWIYISDKTTYSQQAYFKCLSFCLHRNQMNQLYHKYLTVGSNQNLYLCLCFLQVDYCNSLYSGCPLYLLSRPKKLRTLQQNWFSKYTNTIMCIFKFCFGYQSTPEQTWNFHHMRAC